MRAISATEKAASVRAGRMMLAAPSEPAAGSRELPAELLQRIVEGALLAAGKPLAVDDLATLFEDDERPSAQAIRAALAAIAEQSAGRGFELREVASGYRFQVVQEVAPWIARLWEEKPQKYSRALLETLALIAYRLAVSSGKDEEFTHVEAAATTAWSLAGLIWVASAVGSRWSVSSELMLSVAALHAVAALYLLRATSFAAARKIVIASGSFCLATVLLSETMFRNFAKTPNAPRLDALRSPPKSKPDTLVTPGVLPDLSHDTSAKE